MTPEKKLECRIVVTYRRDGKVAVSMCDPRSGKVQKPIVCDGSLTQVDRVVGDLKRSIEQAGHLLTFCERNE